MSCRADDGELEQLSDDEVFFGKLTLKEIRKHIFLDSQPWSISAVNSPANTNSNDPDTSLKIIQTQSQPNLRSGKFDLNFGSPAFSPYKIEKAEAYDSFLEAENIVDQVCQASKNKEPELNNTLEVIEYILNNPPTHIPHVKQESGNSESNDDKENNELRESSPNTHIIKSENISIYPCAEDKDAPETGSNEPCGDQAKNKRILKSEHNDETKLMVKAPLSDNKQDVVKKGIDRLVKTPSRLCTPRKDVTPSVNKGKTLFKTPGQPLSQKKPTVTPLKTPSKINTFKHISSPIACYIKNTPIVPLVKDVQPKKPLPVSSIPKPIKSNVTKSNKENIALPSVAYETAKKTKMIVIPDDVKLPQSHWKKNITSHPKPMVITHSHREVNLAKKVLTKQQENSFADLTYHQAEVSVCTKKSAFKQ